MPRTDVDGWEIEYGDEGSGPPIVLIHGLLMDRTMFDAQVAALKDRYRIITPDLRNHGGSESRSEEITQWDMVEDHVSLCDQLGIDRAVFGGVSQGGFQSMRLAAKYPERVAGLILIDTQAGAEDPTKAPMYEAMASVVESDGWTDDILEVASQIIVTSPDDMRSHWIHRWRQLDPKHASATLFAVTRREDFTDRLREVNAPAIVIHGEADAAIEIELAEALADGLPQLVEFVRIPEAGHSSSSTHPEPVTEAIERFLQKVYPV